MMTFPRRSVLVLEDSDDDFDTIEAAARLSGLSGPLYRGTTGEDCLDLLEGVGAPPLRPSMQLLDLYTPGMNGREALVAIRALPALRALPVVIFSTSATPKDLAHCYGHGVNAYHVKPLRYADHVGLVCDVLTYWLRRVELPASSGGGL